MMVHMSEEAKTKEEAAEVSVGDESKQGKRSQAPLQELVDSLRSVEEDIGQISELSVEERALVVEFFECLLKLMEPLATSIDVSTVAIAEEASRAMQASVDPTGHLILLYDDGTVELKDLSIEKNRELLVKVVEDIAPKFKQLTSANRRKIENRIKIFSAVTKEMQKISKALSIYSNPSTSQ